MSVRVLFLMVLWCGCDSYRRFSLTNCNGGASEVITISSFSISPYPVVIPGNLTAAVDFEVFRNVTGNVKLDVQITKILSYWDLFETRIGVPCFTNVGSCEYDLCSLLGHFENNGVPNCPSQLVSNNIPCTCPITADTYSFRPSQFRIPTLTRIWSWFVAGDYEVKLTLTDSRTQEQIGCYKSDLSIQYPCSGYWCSLLRRRRKRNAEIKLFE